MPEPPLKYDVFLSYSHLDGDWVRGFLLPRLEGAGLEVIFDGRFEPGVASVTNMTRAVEESRHTLIVLTPAWVASPWTGLEGLLTAARDPIGQGTSLIPLLVEPCTPPKWISMLTYIDLTRSEECELEMERLLKTLCGSRRENVDQRSEPVRVEPFRRGLAVLGELVQEAAVRRAVVAFSIHFAEARQQIEVLSSYKDLHDLLHRLQHDCYEPMEEEAERFPDDEEGRENLLIHEQSLEEALEELGELGRRGEFVGDEPGRIWKDLEAVSEGLRASLDASDTAELRSALRQLDRVLARWPPRINVRLNDAARALNLPQLAASMETVCGRLRELNLRPEQVAQFEEGVVALSRLARTLTNLVGDHDQWQLIEQDLRQIGGDLARSLEELESAWPSLKRQMEPLYLGIAERWALALKTESEKLENTLAAQDPTRVRLCFRSYRRQAERRFFRVDDALKRQCHELRQAGEPLAAVLRILE